MVVMLWAIVTCSLSRRVDSSCLGAHRFKTEADALFPPLSVSFLSFLLLLPPPSYLFSIGLSAPLRCSRWEVTPRSCRRRDRGAWSEEEVAIPTLAETSAGHAPGGGDGAVVVVPIASSGSPFQLYVTLGVRLLSSGRARARRRRRGGSRRPRS
ncbi:hypothetical protein Taro_003243 [Colocasia esculenta]|uniref:Uncharacterized protein n=1 Tax=Colocasia esculenta TaxID=4460 RepID=A0A843TIS8_COLES|nr:hypothetical protein [Colocasia esculenta]